MSEPKRSARPYSTAVGEPPLSGLPGDPALREIFLSPRVVDREAFNDFSGSLKKLIEQASGHNDVLRQATTEANSAHQQLRDLASKHTAKFELAARALQSLDERSAKAEQMLLAVQEAALSLDTFKGEAQRIVQESVRLFDQHVSQALAKAGELTEHAARGAWAVIEADAAALLARVQGSAKALDDRAALAESRLEAARSAMAEYEARALARIEARAEELRKGGDDAARRVELLIETVEHRAAQARRLVEELERQALGRVEARADEAHLRMDQALAQSALLAEQTQARAEQACKAVGELEAQAVRRVEAAGTAGEARVNQLVQAVTELEAQALGKLGARLSEAEQRLEAAAASGEARAKLAIQTVGELEGQTVNRLETLADAARREVDLAVAGAGAAAARAVESVEQLKAGVVGAVDARAAEAQRRLDDAVTMAESRSAQARQAIDETWAQAAANLESRRVESLQTAEASTRRIEAAVQAHDGRLAEARQTISGLEARAVESIDEAAANARRSFDGVCEALAGQAEELRLSLAAGAEIHRERLDQHADAAAARLGVETQGAELRAHRVLNEAIDKLDRARDSVSGEGEASIRAIVQAREAGVRELKQVGQGVAREADSAASKIALAASDAAARAEDHHRRLADLQVRLEEAAGEAEALVGLSAALPDESEDEANGAAESSALPGSLGDLVLKARRVRRQAEFALRQLEATRTQAQEARSILGQDLLDSAEKIDALSARAEELRSTLSESLGACQEAGEALTERRLALEQAAAAPMADLQARSDELRTQIEAMAGQTERAREVTRSVVEQTTKVLRGMSDLLTELRPWQPLLLEHDEEAPLPEPLRRLVEQVRGEIAGDLGKIATGLQQMAFKAQRVSDTVHGGAPA